MKWVNAGWGAYLALQDILCFDAWPVVESGIDGGNEGQKLFWRGYGQPSEVYSPFVLVETTKESLTHSFYTGVQSPRPDVGVDRRAV